MRIKKNSIKKPIVSKWGELEMLHKIKKMPKKNAMKKRRLESLLINK